MSSLSVHANRELVSSRDLGKQALIQQLGKAVLLYAEDPAVLRTAAAKAANALHPHGADHCKHFVTPSSAAIEARSRQLRLDRKYQRTQKMMTSSENLNDTPAFKDERCGIVTL